jgi:hypothetical protein
LAALKVEDPKGYEEFSSHYGVSLDVKITKAPEAKPEVRKPAPKKVEIKPVQ